MLKFEKELKSSTLKLRFRERDNFFEPQLLKAMGVALLLHAAGLLIFHVTPFKFSSTFVFPPVEVHFDRSLKSSAAAFTLNDHDRDTLPPPPLHLMPELHVFASTPTSSLKPDIAFNTDILNALEEPIWPSWSSTVDIPIEVPLIRLWSSGGIAEREVINSEPLLDRVLHFISNSDPVFVSYNVLLDDRKGEIFWYERTQSSAIDAVDQLTEKILLNRRYATQRSDETIGKAIEGTLTFAVMHRELDLDKLVEERDD